MALHENQSPGPQLAQEDDELLDRFRKAWEAGPGPGGAVGGEPMEAPPAQLETDPTLREPGLAAEAGQAELGEPGLDSFIARLEIAGAQTWEEKLLAFYKHFPDGEMIVRNDPATAGEKFSPRDLLLSPETVTGLPVILFSESQDQPFRRLDDRDERFSEVVMDIVDFIGPDLGAISGAIMSVPLGRVAGLGGRVVAGGVKKLLPFLANRAEQARKTNIRNFMAGKPAPSAPLGAPPRPLFGIASKGAAGAIAGEAGQEGIQAKRGIAGEEFQQVAERAALQGVYEFAGAKIFGVPVAAAINMFKGAGLFGVRAGGREAIRSAEALGLGELPLNLVMASPLVRRLANQSSAIVSTIPMHMEMLEVGMVRLLDDHARVLHDMSTVNMSVILRVADTEEQLLMNKVFAQTNRGAVSLTEGGQALGRAIAEWDLKSRGLVDAAYTVARRFGTPKFDTVPLEVAVRQAEDLAQQLGQTADRSGLNDLVRQIDGLLASRTGTDPTKITRIQREIARISDADAARDGSLAARRQHFERQLEREQNRGELLIPGRRMPNGEIQDATDQLNFIRTVTGDLAQPLPGQRVTASNRVANDLRKAIDGVLDNPTNTDPAFVAAWSDARGVANRRYIVRDQTVLVETIQRVRQSFAATTDEPAFEVALQSLVARLGRFGEAENIANWKLLKRVMPLDEIEKVKSSIVTSLLNSPELLTGRLQSANRDVLAEIFSPRDIGSLLELGTGWDLWARVGVRESVQRQFALGATVGEMVVRSDGASVHLLLDVVQRNGGVDGEVGRTVRAGLFDFLRRSSIEFKEGTDRINYGKWQATLKNLAQNDANRFFTTDEWQFLLNVRNVQSFLEAGADVGASMSGAAAGRGLARLNPMAMRTYFENIILARAFLSPKWRRRLVGSGGTKIDSDFLKLLAGTVTLAATDATARAPQISDIVRNFATDPNALLGATTGAAAGALAAGIVGATVFGVAGALIGKRYLDINPAGPGPGDPVN